MRPRTIAQWRWGVPSKSFSSLAMVSPMRASRSSCSDMAPSVHEMGYDDQVRWLGLVLLLAACGQDESYFQNPNPSNLGKDPYDFAATKYPRDFSAVVPDDLGSNLVLDLTIRKDLTIIGDSHD